MDIVVKILQFVASFSLIIIIHELGHFFFARLFGIKVEKFYLFFNPWFSLVKFKIGETEYGIGWVPFGGYVKIAGMIDESMDTDQMSKPAQKNEFRSKPAWQRLLVMLGGVIMNLVLALSIYIGMSWAWGDKYIANDDIAYGWAFNDLAQEIGFKNGDKIVSVGGEKVENFAMIYAEIVINGAPDVDVLRDGEVLTLQIPQRYLEDMLQSLDFMEPRTPFVTSLVVEQGRAAIAGLQPGDSLVALNGEPMLFYDQYQKALLANANQSVMIDLVRRSADGVEVGESLSVEVSEDGKIGLGIKNIAAYVPVQTTDYTFAQAIPAGVKRTGAQISNYWKQLKLIVKPNTGAYKSLGGPVAIASIFPTYWSWEAFWSITAFLSLVLAVMNILPIPGLDGGHVMFVLYEILTGRKPSDRFMEFAMLVGVVLLFSIIIFATGNDILRLFR